MLRVGVPKKAEIYYFFCIDDKRVKEFRHDLTKFIPLITTTAQLIKTRQQIDENKRAGGGRLKISGISLAFSKKGLKLVGVLSASIVPY